jgi:hypothetical protein
MYHCFTAATEPTSTRDLPSYIVECVLTIVFSLISHPQLSIRETVAKIMAVQLEHVGAEVQDCVYCVLTDGERWGQECLCVCLRSCVCSCVFEMQ